MIQAAKPSGTLSRRYRWHGVLVSLALHLGLTIVLLAIAHRPWWCGSWQSGPARIIQAGYAEVGKRQQENTTEQVRVVTDPVEVTAEMAAQQIQQQIAAAEAMPGTEKRERLGELSERLSALSTHETVDAMAEVFQQWFGTDPRATRPSPTAAADDFDFDSAQFHDVTRNRGDDGVYHYAAILLDAEGRTTEVELSQTEGETLYETMQQIKQNPLLEQVYRQIVMPLLDQIIAGAQQTQTLSPAAPSDNPASETDPTNCNESDHL